MVELCVPGHLPPGFQQQTADVLGTHSLEVVKKEGLALHTAGMGACFLTNATL
jgi:hypothetical protein